MKVQFILVNYETAASVLVYVVHRPKGYTKNQ